MKNLYLDTSRPQITTPQLTESLTADVAIIGGGYTGVSAALHLAEQGVKVCLVEAGEVGHGCSGRNGGQVNPGLKLLPDAVESHWGKDLGSRMNRMAFEAPNYVFELIERHEIDCAPSRTGTIRAAIDADGVKHVNLLAGQCQRRDLPVHFLSAEEMRERTGTHFYRAGAFDARGGHVNPLAYVRGLALATKRAGAQIYSQSRARAVQRTGASWSVTVGAHTLTAGELILCPNGYADDLWPGLRQALIPIYTYITASDPLPEAVHKAIMPCRSSLYEYAWDIIYYRIDDTGRLLMGGRGAQRDGRGTEDYRHLVDHARKLWPELKEISFPWNWYGQIALTKDKFPHLVTPEPGVHLMFGYNGRGIALATMAGRMLARRIVSGGKEEIDLPVRETLSYIPFHGFWRAGAEIAVKWNQVKDWITGR